MDVVDYDDDDNFSRDIKSVGDCLLINKIILQRSSFSSYIIPSLIQQVAGAPHVFYVYASIY